MTSTRRAKPATLTPAPESPSPAPEVVAQLQAAATIPPVTYLDLMTTAEVARQLQVHVKTVRRWIAEHELAAYRVGREFRVSPAHVLDFLGKRSAATAQPPAPTRVTPDGPATLAL